MGRRLLNSSEDPALPIPLSPASSELNLWEAAEPDPPGFTVGLHAAPCLQCFATAEGPEGGEPEVPQLEESIPCMSLPPG